MHLTVGFLSTPTGYDGIALAGVLAATFDATVDVVLVVRHEVPDGFPGRAAYQQLLVERGENWVAEAITTLNTYLPDDAESASGNVVVGESFAGSLIEFAEEKSSDLIVLGGARDGLLGGAMLGAVSFELLHCSPIPVALAPRSYADDRPDRLTRLTAAVPTSGRGDNPLPFALKLARQVGGLPIRMVSLVSLDDDTDADVRKAQIDAAEANLALAAKAVPDAPAIESIVAQGDTLRSALDQLTWEPGDALVVGSARFAPPRRVFLGSTAARILDGTAAPVIVVPKPE